MSRLSLSLPLVFLLLGCGDKSDETGAAGGGDGGDGGGGESDTDTDTDTDTDADWTAPSGGTIELTTEDEVKLVADYYPVDQEGAPGVVLLHMIPPNWDRSSWPSDFIASLNGEGYAVLVPDRRGAGDSEGRAVDAYTGPKGRMDVSACVAQLRGDGYTGPLAVIGASNGTTSALDYAVWAAAAQDSGFPVPATVGFMTGGVYTEAQYAMTDIPPVNAFFTYSTEERGWSVQQTEISTGNWEFREYPSGAHGTQMFNAAPEVSADILTDLALSLTQ